MDGDNEVPLATTTMPSKRKTSQDDGCSNPSCEIHGRAGNQESGTRNKSRRVDEPARMLANGQQNHDNAVAAAAAAPAAPAAPPEPNQARPGAPPLISSNNEEPPARTEASDRRNNTQNHDAVSVIFQPQPPPPPPPASRPLPSQAVTATSPPGALLLTAHSNALSSLLEIFPLDSGDCFSVGKTQTKVYLSTFRPKRFHFKLYNNWICCAIDVILNPNWLAKPSFNPFTWQRLEEKNVSPRLPIAPVTTLPPRVDIPQLQIGHLFSTAVFGNDGDVPLYYIQLVRGLSDVFKTIVCCSKREVISSISYEASCGYSTVFICAICQNASPRLLTTEGFTSLMTQSNTSVEYAQELLQKDDKLAIIY